MEFRNLKKQYLVLKNEIDKNIMDVLNNANFISGYQVKELETVLAEYVGVKHCISCANGTDALQLALITWGIGKNDAVFVPDFTFFSSGEVVSAIGATPIFVDVREDTFNIDVEKLKMEIIKTIKEKKLTPKAIIAVDLFGQPAEYDAIRKLAKQYDLYVLEDAAQGFGGSINGKRACSFGDISTTSFFPAKPFGCYGDGGAVFTNNDEWAELIESYRIHGKGVSKYDNVRIGMNSRLDTIQAAVLLAKFDTFRNKEVDAVNRVAEVYSIEMKDIVEIPIILPQYFSSWAQYTIKLKDERQRDNLQSYLRMEKIPCMIYYQKPLHSQTAFSTSDKDNDSFSVTNSICKRVLSLPLSPYMCDDEINDVVMKVKYFILNSGISPV